MSPFHIREWLTRRLGIRIITEEIHILQPPAPADNRDGGNRDDDNLDTANVNDTNELFNNEAALFQFIMRRWIDEMEQMDRANRALPLFQRAGNTNTWAATAPEIPVLNIDDVEQALRDHMNYTQRGTQWIQFINLVSFTLMPLLFVRILMNVFSFVSLSDDILEDTSHFWNYIEEHNFTSWDEQTKREMSKNPRSNSLIFKFGEIIFQELGPYFDTPRPFLLRYLTLCSFYLYTLANSFFMMVSFVLFLACITYFFGKRWSYIDEYLVKMTRNSNGVF